MIASGLKTAMSSSAVPQTTLKATKIDSELELYASPMKSRMRRVRAIASCVVFCPLPSQKVTAIRSTSCQAFSELTKTETSPGPPLNREHPGYIARDLFHGDLLNGDLLHY